VSPTPTRDTSEGRAYNDLRNLAKKRSRNAAEYFTLYALEGLLTRLSVSDQAGNLVLKGGVLLAAFAVRRPTRDIDLAASGFPNDVTECEQRIRNIAAVPMEDGLTYDLESVQGEVIREESDYSGARVHLEARLASARIAFHVDVNFGDPIWPAPKLTDLPLLLGGSVRLLGYPDHMVVAEKIVTAIERGEANTRWRDFVDIESLSSRRVFSAASLSEAISVVATHRAIELAPIGQILAAMSPAAQPKWSAWRRKQQLETSAPEHFSVLLGRCIEFADPVIEGTARDKCWSPSERRWQH
jgi:hypothetical protein